MVLAIRCFARFPSSGHPARAHHVNRLFVIREQHAGRIRVIVLPLCRPAVDRVGFELGECVVSLPCRRLCTRAPVSCVRWTSHTCARLLSHFRRLNCTPRRSTRCWQAQESRPQRGQQHLEPGSTKMPPPAPRGAAHLARRQLHRWRWRPAGNPRRCRRPRGRPGDRRPRTLGRTISARPWLG